MLASSPRPFEGEEKGPDTHCLCMPRYLKNLRGLDTIVYLSAHKSAYVSMFYSLLLDTCPLNHILIVLFNYKQISFVKINIVAYVPFERSRRIPTLKRTGKETDCVASFVTEIVFKAKLNSCMGE